MVKSNIPKITWAFIAEKSLREAHRYIKEHSPANAEKVKDAIIELIEKIPENPERHGLDKFKKNNPGNYRAFEKYNYRIAYRHTDKEIRILRIRHTSREPSEY